MKNNTWTKGCDVGFTVGQKAWHNRFGWGRIIKIENDTNYPIIFMADWAKASHSFAIDGTWHEEDLYPLLFHKEQTFDYGKPEWQPKPGELCWVWKDGWQVPNTRIFSYFADDAYWCRTTCGDNEMLYTYCAPFNGGKLPEQFAHLLKGGSE